MTSGTRLSRTVVKTIHARSQSEGSNALVRRSIGGYELRNFTPFLMLDHFSLAPGSGFPDHPHRGQVTVTYMLKGFVEHEDFAGHRGKIGPGDLQWMTAGKGIVHAEMPVFGPDLPNPEGLQLWIDLPAEHKMTPPTYQEIESTSLPVAHPSEGVEIKVISGVAQGSEAEGEVKSPVRTLGGCWYFDIKLKGKEKQVWQSIPEGWNAFAYTLSGKVSINHSSPIDAYNTVTLSSVLPQNGVLISSSNENEEEETRLVLIAAEILNQEVVQYGPFVMTSKEEIQQAFVDYQLGRNGFENARSWRSEIGKPLM